MNKSTCFVNPAPPRAVAVVPNEGSEGSAIPLCNVQFFDFTDEAIGLPDARGRGIAQWDAWWERSQLTRHLVTNYS